MPNLIPVKSIFGNIPFQYEQLNEFQSVLTGSINGIPVAILIHEHDKDHKDYSLYANYDKEHPIAVGESEERIKEIITHMIQLSK